MASPPITRVVSKKVERYTIWDNFARHEQELRSVGATDTDIEVLRKAAAAVDVLERQADIDAGRNPVLERSDLAAVTAPRTCANGWVIAPPTALAGRWAMMGARRRTKGAPPEDHLVVVAMILVSLWVLREWANGRHDAVMTLLMSAGRLSALIPELLDAFEPATFDGLVDDYSALMGIDAQKKRVQTTAEYNATLAAIRTRLSASTTAPS